MASGLLSLKWNNHRSTFFHVLSTIRQKESYCDVTIACDGRFYSLHKFVLSTCSDYFEEMFEKTNCKSPVIVLKDIKCDDLEALLNYMYVGEVNVEQEKLAGLIKAAECLKIKGLAVPDEDPLQNERSGSHKRSQRNEDSPRAKRRRRDNSSDVDERITNSAKTRTSNSKNRDSLSSQPKSNNGTDNLDARDQKPQDSQGQEKSSDESENCSINANRQQSNFIKISSSQRKGSVPEEVTLDDENVKSEPLDLDNSDIPDENDIHDDKDTLHQELGFDDSMGGGDDENYGDASSLLQPQSVEDVVAQSLPGSSGFQGNSFPPWEGDGNFDGYSGEDNSGSGRQMDVDRSNHDTTMHGDSFYPFISEEQCVVFKFICTYCGKGFKNKGDYKRHEMIHTREGYTCPHCTYVNVRPDRLRLHVEKKHCL